MLLELYIKNIALVDEIRVDFDKGLNVLTGETGAGKSVIVGAIMQILGDRADTRVIREGEKSALVEGSFDCSAVPRVREQLVRQGIALDQDQVMIIRREFSQDGRNKCYINGYLTTLSCVKAIGDPLVDIHSQNDHQSLLRKNTHLDFLDRCGGLWPEREKIEDLYSKLRKMKSELEEIDRTRQQNERMREMNEFHLKEIDSAQLTTGEEDELRNRRRVLLNAERLHELLSSLYGELKDSDNSAISLVRSASRHLSEAAKIDERLTDPLRLLEESLVSIEEAANSARENMDSMDFSLQELEATEERLQLILSLKRKFGSTIEEILKYRNEIREELGKMTHRDEDAGKLRKEIEKLEKRLRSLSEALSRKRREQASIMSTSVVKELKQLGMEHGKFSVRVDQHEISRTGIDDIEFLISPNLGEQLKPLREIASSGEISRIMLAIKTVLGENDSTPVLIFDEIDVNIGGNTAVGVGERLSAIGEGHQVICITHMPQVARFADTHFRVRKEVRNRRTLTYVDKLNKDERAEELARMFGSSPDERTSTRPAKTMTRKRKGGS
jgi:DNA repair protein RecN (Recombination protein N)